MKYRIRRAVLSIVILLAFYGWLSWNAMEQEQKNNFYEKVIIIIALVVLTILVILIFVGFQKLHIKSIINYYRSYYYKQKKISYKKMVSDKGAFGEYQVCEKLKCYLNQGAKLVLNAFIPKENGETSEVDIAMICSKGIFVFESKNYKGWIFGSKESGVWCQTLPSKTDAQKEYFLNPFVQNRGHIKALKDYVGQDIPMISVIAFSDDCVLKNDIDLLSGSDDEYVTYYSGVASMVQLIIDKGIDCSMSEDNINCLYDKLYVCTQVDEATKQQHIADVKNHTLKRSK